MLLKQRIEKVSLNSWPALQQILFDGWILRFSEGYTKRANSVNPLFASSMDVEEKVDTCERPKPLRCPSFYEKQRGRGFGFFQKAVS